VKRILLSVKELAFELGISEKSVRRAYRKREIPGERICRMIRFDLDRVREAMRSKGLHEALRAGAVRSGAARRRGPRPRPRPGNTGAQITKRVSRRS
jgi:excisionase family DNA binding protein